MTPIGIKFDSGISDSPQTGFDVIANCDIDETGAIKPGLKYHVTNYADASITFTADETTDIITHSDMTDSVTGISGNDVRAVTLTTTGTLPAGLSTSTTYWLVKVSNTQSKLCSTWQNAVTTPNPVTINFTTNGTGTHTLTSINMGTIKAIDSYSTRKFAIDSSGKVWVNNSNSDGWEYIFTKETDAASTGLVIFKKYVLAFGQQKIDALGPLDSDRKDWVRTADFIDTGYSSVNKDMIVTAGIGDIIETVYYTNGNDIGQIYENSGQTFNPANGATYTSDTSVFTTQYIQTCLGDFGDNLAIGTEKGIYLWDKDSDTADLPILPCKYIASIVVAHNLIFALAGESSTETLGLYESNGTSVNLISQVPRRMATAGIGKPRGMMAIKNKIYFLLSQTYCIYNSNTYNGLWSYNLGTGRLTLENLPTSGSYNTNTGCIFGVNSQVSRPEYFASGTQIGRITNFDDEYQLYDNYEPYFISQLFVFGTADHKNVPTNMDFILDRPLESSDEIRISYRRSTQGNFSATIEDTLSYTKNGAKATINFPLSVIDTDIIQFKFEINTENSGISGPTIKEIIMS